MGVCTNSALRARFVWLAAAACLLAVALAAPQTAAQSLVGFDSRCIQIDLGANGANVFLDGGASNNTPTCGSTFIDWEDFGTALSGHQIVDGVGNADADIVGPQSKLVSGSTLPKQDVYALYASNNTEYLYMAMARRANNGNSMWHWFFTKEPPTFIAGQPITFHVQNGDFEVRVCFPRGSSPGDFTAEIYQVSGLGAGQVLDVVAGDIWSSVPLSLNPSAIAAFSINLTTTAALPGSLDDHGNPTTTYDVATFAEGAVDLGALGISPCNSTAYVTVLTRSSCSLTSDLKDTTSPVEYHFGDLTTTLGTPTIGCTTAPGAVVTLTATASGGTGSFDWTWPAGWSHTESGDTLSSTGTATLAPGSHEICVTANLCGAPECADEACVTVDIPDQLQVSIGAPVIECTTESGAQVTLTATPSGGTSPYSYAWSEGGSPLGSGNPLIHTFSPGSHTVRVDVTDDAGCTNYDEVTFDVPDQVLVSIGAPVIECTTDSGAQVTLTATAGGGTSPYSYAWSEGGSPLGSGNPLIYTFSPGSHTVRVDVTDDVGCTAYAEKTFDVLDKVTVSIGTPVIECTVDSDAQVTLTATPSGGDGSFTYEWYEGAVLLGTSNPLISDFSVGDHTVKVIATDSRGCWAEAEVTFSIPPPLSLNLEVTSSLDCVSSVDLEATASGGDGDYTYTWKVDDVVVFTDHQASGGPSQYTVVFPDDEYCGARTVTVEVEDGHGCKNPPPSPGKTLTKGTAIEIS